MAINVYTGLQGSGKSYEVVSSVIVPALAKGRRVVTNVYGLDIDKIKAFITDHYKKIKQESIGQLVVIDNDDINDLFFHFGQDDQQTIVQPGDLVAIDEAWRFWGSDIKLHQNHKVFFREHRHYVSHETRLSCDLALMTQDITDIHKYLKNVVEQTFVMAKHKRFGMTNYYRVAVYEGAKLYKSKLVSTLQKKYNPKVFPLYKSYDLDGAQEDVIDDRQNIFKRKSLWLLIVFLVSLVIISLHYLVSFFNPEFDSQEVDHQQTESLVTVQSPSMPIYSTKWRISGHLVNNGFHFVVLSDYNGNFRMESQSLFSGQGVQMVGEIDGELVTVFTGQNDVEGIFQ